MFLLSLACMVSMYLPALLYINSKVPIQGMLSCQLLCLQFKKGNRFVGDGAQGLAYSLCGLALSSVIVTFVLKYRRWEETDRV